MLSDSLLLKYCPSCGKDTFISKSEKQRFCTSCEFVYYHNVAAATAVILRYKGKMLFSVRKFPPAEGTFDLPGGFVDFNESAEDGLRREIKEELNLDITAIQYINSYPNTYIYKEVEYRTLDLVYTAEIQSIENIHAADDISDYVLFQPTEIQLEKIGLLSIRKAVAEYLQTISQ
jgi:NAD+ diphosphatase